MPALCVQSPEGDARIMEGSEVRMRIMGTRVDQQDIVSAGRAGPETYWILKGE